MQENILGNVVEIKKDEWINLNEEEDPWVDSPESPKSPTYSYS